ncbi:MAG TPA: glucosaminidase domain-containing protein [Ktedonobacteraceae bacterium]
MRRGKWLVFVCCVLLLWYWWQCYTLMTFGGGLLAHKPSLPRISVMAPLSMHVNDASSNVTGPPTISADFIDRVLSAYGSPAAGTGQALYDFGVESGIDPVYALAFFLHEDSFGETGIGAVNHSLGNIRCSDGYTCQDGFRSYATWADGYQDWYALILNGYVKGQITDAIVGHPCTTIDEIVPVYAPSSDHNNVSAYIAAIERAVTTWRKGQVWV